MFRRCLLGIGRGVLFFFYLVRIFELVVWKFVFNKYVVDGKIFWNFLIVRIGFGFWTMSWIRG